MSATLEEHRADLRASTTSVTLEPTVGPQGPTAPPKRVLVTGSRDWTDRFAVFRALTGWCVEHGLMYEPDEFGNTMPDSRKVVVVHGHCPTGADHWADEWAWSNFLTPERHPADWKRFGRRAGYIRNDQMVQLGADVCLAFILNASPGATMCARLAEAAGIETIRYEVTHP